MNFKTLFLAAAALLLVSSGVQADSERRCECRDEVTYCYQDCTESADNLAACLR
ncbi:hypothetical protein HDV05_006690, partial [Chytridiales sp. JEL 0842]